MKIAFAILLLPLGSKNPQEDYLPLPNTRNLNYKESDGRDFDGNKLKKMLKTSKDPSIICERCDILL